ncbi:MAG: D-glycero-beta-D-manno-heptose-7-phosphate kinase [Candidatus Zhuqueibacterota bacterium]
MITIDSPRLDSFFNSFKDKKIIVLGDVMLDRYLWGIVDRISPEAPVPVVEISEEFTRLGGAANVANNLFSLGATPIPIGIIGDDQEGEQLLSQLKKLGFPTEFIIKDPSRPTAIKTRIIANDQHVVRADRESRHPVDTAIAKKVNQAVRETLRQADALIFQDYNKGLLTKSIITQAIEEANAQKTIVTVDPKFENFFAFKTVTLFKPNRKEIEAALGVRIISEEILKESCLKLMSKLQCNAVLVTLGEAGMCLLESSGEFTLAPTKARKVHDVSGAGDTVISTLTLALASGASLKEAITLANYAAGAVCEEVGVVPIDPIKLRYAVEHFN